jgi:ABC-type branched-subunit amino acid transport system substrate-binding protein
MWWLLPAIVAILLGAQQPEPVRLGLLVPGGELGLAARRGAAIAVEAANRDGGFRGRPFELVVQSVEGPWGSGSGKITALVFQESVWAILGPLHGRSAHLAEQVAAKGHVALVSPWASDPTLTQANVPWFFRCVPDDRQQAAALVREIFRARRLDRVVAVVADSYDARVAADAFAAAAAASTAATGSSHPARWQLPETAEDLDPMLDRLQDEEVQGAVLFGPDSATGALIRRLRARGMRQRLFAPLSSADLAMPASELSDVGEMVVVAPGHWVTAEGRAFERAFRDAYDAEPNAVSAYSHDGLMVIVEAVRRAGLDRQRIRDALAEIDYGPGVTGRVRFDDRGNRVAEVELIDVALR